MLKLGNVQVRNLMSYVPEDGVYDLVVFDNMDLVQVDNKRLLDRGEVERPQRVLDRIEMMTHILEKTHYYVIHYGPYLYWVEEHEDRFRFADTRFELFKTIHDMLFFINSYRV